MKTFTLKCQILGHHIPLSLEKCLYVFLCSQNELGHVRGFCSEKNVDKNIYFEELFIRRIKWKSICAWHIIGTQLTLVSLFPSSLSRLSVFLVPGQYETQFLYTVFLGLAETIVGKWQCSLEKKTFRVEVYMPVRKYLHIPSKLKLWSYLLWNSS